MRVISAVLLANIPPLKAELERARTISEEFKTYDSTAKKSVDLQGFIKARSETPDTCMLAAALYRADLKSASGHQSDAYHPICFYATIGQTKYRVDIREQHSFNTPHPWINAIEVVSNALIELEVRFGLSPHPRIFIL